MERLTKVMQCDDGNKLYDYSNEVIRNVKDFSSRLELMFQKLAEYEDLEEQGLLLKLPCSRVYYIVDKGTKYATVTSKPIQDLRVFEIKGIDKDGYYWSTQEQAEQKLKEMESDKNV